MMSTSGVTTPEPGTSSNEEAARTGVGGVVAAQTSNQGDQVPRPNNNVQRIQQRKKQVFNWPHSKKLLKLAIYSACQVLPNQLVFYFLAFVTISVIHAYFTVPYL